MAERAITTEVIKVENFHEADVQTMECGRCEEEFPSIGFPDYCPQCGTEFSGTATLIKPGARGKMSGKGDHV